MFSSPQPWFGLLRASVLLSCLLTLAASGDDFCFARAVFSCARTAASMLPLDDPNTDFVEQTDSWSDRAAHDEGGADRVAPGAAPVTTLVAVADGLPLLTLGQPAHSGGSGPEPLPRLRC
jgi:hypothetical protein